MEQITKIKDRKTKKEANERMKQPKSKNKWQTSKTERNTKTQERTIKKQRSKKKKTYSSKMTLCSTSYHNQRLEICTWLGPECWPASVQRDARALSGLPKDLDTKSGDFYMEIPLSGLDEINNRHLQNIKSNGKLKKHH